MIIVSYGNTLGQTRKFLEAKKLFGFDDEIRKIDPAGWSEESIDELIQTKGLFLDREVFFVDHVLSELEPEEVAKNSKILSESDNLIVFMESKATRYAEKIEKLAEYVFRAPLKKEEKLFNVFSLSDALFAKDKKKLWLFYQEGLLGGADPEFDIHRILFWGIKMLALAKNYASAASAGVSPFVYSKAKKGVVNFKDDELEKLVQNLTNMTIRARRGEEWEILLEQFILTI